MVTTMPGAPGLDAARIAELARRLYDAAASRTLVPPLTDEAPDLSTADAYAIQDELLALHLAGGATPVGRKLGLTSRAKQVEMKVDQPIHGFLTDRMAIEPAEPLDVSSLGQPRVEPEVAFLLGRELEGAGVTAMHVLAATEAVFPTLDVLDSRYADYRFTLPDVVADNASGGRFVLGGAASPGGFDLAEIGCVLTANGEVRSTAAGAAALGHPARAVAWLVRRLASSGSGLRAGDLVLSGGLTTVVRVAPGDVVTAAFGRIGSVSLACVGPADEERR